MKGFLSFLLSILTILLLASGAFALDIFKRTNVVVPRTVLGDMDLSGMTRESVRELVRERLTEFTEASFQIGSRGQAATATLKEAGVRIGETEILDAVPFAANVSNAKLLLMSIAGQRVLPHVTVERPEIMRLIDEKFPDIPRARNARLVLEGKEPVIMEGETGVRPVPDPLIEQIWNNAAFLEHLPVFVEFEEVAPTVSAEDIKPYMEAIKKIISEPVKLVFTDTREHLWEADFATHPDWLVFDKKPYEVAEGDLPFTLQWDPVVFSRYVNGDISKLLEQKPEDIRIWTETNSDGEQIVQFDGRAIAGKAIERERLLTRINNSLTAESTDEEVDPRKVGVPLVVVEPKVEVSDDLKELGIQELIAIGHSAFKGSPANRKHNIGVGMSKYNGLIIPAGATFSFNDNLGVVDGSTGYLKELVIKPEGTIPEYGGGLCQVSTTLYRAVLESGLPVTERSPHSFAVSYYSQVGGHGIDATIYPPSRDLKFINDTPGSLLIQSYVDGDDAFFKFYGTSDGRTVSMEGPFISNYKKAPGTPYETIDKTLPPDGRKQVGKPQNGFDALWYQTIVRGGETVRNEIFSRYNAVPAKFMVGEKVTAEGEATGIADTETQ